MGWGDDDREMLERLNDAKTTSMTRRLHGFLWTVHGEKLRMKHIRRRSRLGSSTTTSTSISRLRTIELMQTLLSEADGRTLGSTAWHWRGGRDWAF